MAEIKVLEPVRDEIKAMKSAGLSLIDVSQVMSGDAPNMLCAEKYASQQEKICTLIALYQQLVKKDTREFSKIVENFFTVDESMSGG